MAGRDDHSLYHPCFFAAYCIRMGAGKPLSCFAFSRQGAILQQVEGNPIYPKVVGLKQTIDCIYIRFLITV